MTSFIRTDRRENFITGYPFVIALITDAGPSVNFLRCHRGIVHILFLLVKAIIVDLCIAVRIIVHSIADKSNT